MKIFFYTLRPYDELDYCEQLRRKTGIDYAWTVDAPNPGNLCLAQGCDAVSTNPCTMTPEYLEAFAKMGVMTFGGGMAMLPILQREIVETRHWATEEELTDYYAIGQCTPGIIAVNTATFIGQKYKGIAGGIVATLGIVFPSLVIISILAGLINNFADLAWVQNAFAGIQVCVCVLIFNATLKLMKNSVVDKPTAVIFVVVLIGSTVMDISPVWFILVAAVIGILLKNLEAKRS